MQVGRLSIRSSETGGEQREKALTAPQAPFQSAGRSWSACPLKWAGGPPTKSEFWDTFPSQTGWAPPSEDRPGPQES